MSPDISRRRLLQLGVAGTLAGFAGCTEEEVIAEVVEQRPTELDAPVEGTINIDLLVHNVGAAADLEITIEAIDLDEETEDGQQAVTATASIIEAFDRGEQRELSAEIEPGPEADAILARADAAE